MPGRLGEVPPGPDAPPIGGVAAARTRSNDVTKQAAGLAAFPPERASKPYKMVRAESPLGLRGAMTTSDANDPLNLRALRQSISCLSSQCSRAHFVSSRGLCSTPRPPCAVEARVRGARAGVLRRARGTVRLRRRCAP